MSLRVLPVTQFTIGKFGGSFIDLYRTKQELKYLSPKTGNPAVIGGAMGVGQGTANCVTGFPVNRRIYGIDTSGLKLPITECNTPEALDAFARQFRTTIHASSDKYVNSDIHRDWGTGETYGGVDILQTKYSNGVAHAAASAQQTSWEAVSAITFSIASYRDWEPSCKDPVKVHMAHGRIGACGGAGGGNISRPVVVSDTRNEHGRNLARLSTQRSWSWLKGNRFYLEIRHGLNTENYMALVSEAEYFKQIQKKNSLILTRYISREASERMFSGKPIGVNESLFELPNSRIHVIFYADPCAADRDFLGVTQGVG